MASPLGRYLGCRWSPSAAWPTPPSPCSTRPTPPTPSIAAIAGGPDTPVNVVADGATTPAQAARLGGRVPLPIVGLQWQLARIGAELLGAPLPDHVQELLTPVGSADGSAAADLLGVHPCVDHRRRGARPLRVGAGHPTCARARTSAA